MECSYYPAGAQFSPNAPYNQALPFREVYCAEVSVSRYDEYGQPLGCSTSFVDVPVEAPAQTYIFAGSDIVYDLIHSYIEKLPLVQDSDFEIIDYQRI